MSYTLPSVRSARALALAPALALLAAACSDVTSTPRATDASRVGQTAGEISNLPEGLTEADVRAHVIAPRHIEGARSEDNDPAREIMLRAPSLAPAPALDRASLPTPGTTVATASVNLNTMGLKIHNALKDSVAGYMWEVRQNGVLVFVGQWNWAQTPTNLGTGWSENRRMHVASISKFLTAVGLVKALDAKGISYDAKIVNYLPSYWAKGSNVGQISFRQLLTHTSGFQGNGSASDYNTMKANVANGVSAAAIGTYAYQNLNFGLMRILIPIINGNISKYTVYSSWSFLNDVSWDAATVSQYKTYMQNNVFTPAGVAGASFAPIYNGSNSLAYKLPYAMNQEAGWDSGDLSSVAGGAGWRLSVKELLSVMNHVRRMNTIIPAAKAQYMLDNYFGIDQKIGTAAGTLYNKNGAWGTGDGKTEQAVAYFMPNGMELVLFVNSPIGKTGFSLRGLVKDSYIASLTP
jgi:CubicO group peptidase (beta-lactamase class C family)